MAESISNFKANWRSTNLIDSSLFDYLNQMGTGKVLPIKQALTAYFYPEIAYRQNTIQTNSREVKEAIYHLEARLGYLKNLASEIDSSLATMTSGSFNYAASGQDEIEDLDDSDLLEGQDPYENDL